MFLPLLVSSLYEMAAMEREAMPAGSSMIHQLVKGASGRQIIRITHEKAIGPRSLRGPNRYL